MAGKMSGLTRDEMKKWRNEAKGKIKGATMDPTETNFSTFEVAEIVASNKMMINRSDIVLAEFTHKEHSIGTIGEVVYAHTIGKPVVAFGRPEIIANPWIMGHITAGYENLHEAVDFVNKLSTGIISEARQK